MFIIKVDGRAFGVSPIIKVLFAICFCVFCATSQAATGADVCYSTGGDRFGLNLKTEIDGYLSANEPVGTVIGEVYFEGGGYYCSSVWIPSSGRLVLAPNGFSPWLLYLVPNATGTGSLCATGTEGLGITFYDNKGMALQCTGAKVYLGQIERSNTGSTVPKRMIAKIIKTSEKLKSGHSPLIFSPTALAELSIYSRPWAVTVSGTNSVFVPPREFQIYFPEFPSGSPRVNLMLQKATPSSMEGTRTLSMCLYDGDDASSSRTTLTLMDEGSPAPGRPAGQFSVYRLGGNKTAQTDRVDYQVSIINPTTGAREQVSQGNAIVWNGTAKRAVQHLVSLPGIPGLSHCLPAPLTLRTPAFGIGDKSAGRYNGQLKIIYRPSTT
jgi:hypothetical protein